MPPPPHAVPVAPGKRQKAVPPRGQAKCAKPAAKKPAAKKQKVPAANAAKRKSPAPPPDFDSSDEDVPLDRRTKAPRRKVIDSSDDEL